MITTYCPKDWKDLQNQVAHILRECGFSVEVEKVVENCRGSVEIDVFAEEFVGGRKYSIVCECKKWKAKVPQSVIRDVRNVVADIGVNIRIVITTQEFQSGAFEAANYTNIQLLTWEKFQASFENTWLEKHFHPTITKELDPLFSYSEPLAPAWYSKLCEEDKNIYHVLYEKYSLFGALMFSLSQWGIPFSKGLALPLSGDIINKYNLKNISKKILNAEGYREFLDASVQYGTSAILEFRLIRDKYFDGQVDYPS